MDKFINDLNINDLDGDLKLLADIIGIEAIKELILYASGDSYYIPTPKSFSRLLLKRYLKNIPIDLNAVDRRALIKQFGLCRKSIEDVIFEIKEESNKLRSY